ncbi:MAG: hypothetical protein EBR86_17680 [Planctomycetia bacterium]|nr:hypothetical protein [Planctomycetia bacterium]
MEAYIPLFCLVAVTALLWLSALKHRAADRPVVWTWRMVGAVALGAAGAVAVPFLVAAVIQHS